MSTFVAPSIEELQEKFPTYIIESFIAQGGMGAVYLARQKSLDRPVAIKILPEEFGDDADYRASFETEAKAMARLNHNNLVGIYDFGEMNGMLYIVMEYIPGRSLYETAHGQTVDQMEAARLIADMCDGLDHAHEAGMIHRDIKPANVLINDEARPKIVDFGLARPLGEKQTEGVVFGTPGYTANEVLSDPHAVDHRSDIFSMGVMLYEMLTGQLPAKLVQPASVLSGSDKRFDLIIKKAIHPDPESRYDSAGEMSDALEELIKNFDKPLSGSGAGLLKVGASSSGLALGQRKLTGAGYKPMVKTSSGSGAVWVWLGLLAVVIVIVAMVVGNSDSEPEGPSAAELAAAKETKRLELVAERQKKEEQVRRDQKRRDLAKAERERLAAEEQAEDERLEKRERKEKQKKAREKREKELREAEETARQEAEDAKKPKVVEFDVEKFLEKLRKDYGERVEALQGERAESYEPVFVKLERALKKEVRRWQKGKKAKVAREQMKAYMVEVREAVEILDVPKDLAGGLKKKVNPQIALFRLQTGKLMKAETARVNLMRKLYIEEIAAQRDQLKKSANTPEVEALEDEIEAMVSEKEFLALFEPES